MMRGLRARDLPGRVVTGGFILHSGLEKWKGDENRAKAIHGMAANAFPVLKDVPPTQFLKLLAAGEIAVGGALLAPFVPAALAGAALTGFSGALLAMYARTPALRKPGSIWPSQAGTAVSKDVWMLGIGLGLMAGAVTDGKGTGS
jgi:DoxX